LILIPDQTVYLIPESHHDSTELRALCICKKIEGAQGKNIPLNLKQTEQLVTLIKHTGLGDLKWRNLVHCPDGTIGVIDTDAFWGTYYGLHSLLENNKLDEDSIKLVNSEIMKCMIGARH
jgi:hypothetical protein